MAEGGNPRHVFNIPITVRIDSQMLESTTTTTFEGDRTNIIDSNIDTVVAGAVPNPAQPGDGQPGPGGNQPGPDDQGAEDDNVAEEVQQMNFAKTRSREPAQSAWGTKRKHQMKLRKFDDDDVEVSEKTLPTKMEKKRQTSSKKLVLSDSITKRPTRSSSKGLRNPVEDEQKGTKMESAHASTPSRSHPMTQQESTCAETTDVDKRLKIAFLRERCSAYLRHPKPDYLKVTKFLEDLTTLQPESEFDTMLQLAECYLYLGRESKTDKMIGEIKAVIAASQALSAFDILTLAVDLAANFAHTRAMILFPIACDMFHANALSPDNTVNTMCNCIQQMSLCVLALIKSVERRKVIGIDGIGHMENMYLNMSSVENADPVNKAVKEAWARNYIGGRYSDARESDKALKQRCRGVEILEQQFHGNQSMYSVYGHLLHNIGVAHYNLGNFTKAEKFYLKAIDAYEKATDFSSESKKREFIELSKKNLYETRAKLGKK